jgi:hypothetical protein
MKFKSRLLLVCGFAAIGMLVNSCKKSNQDYIQSLFVGGHWQLSSMQVSYFTGSLTDSVVLRDTSCSFTQLLTFNADKTCSFTNYSCKQQTSSGSWSLSNDKLFLYSGISVDSSGITIKPFKNAQIVNLGQYSLILQTGDLQTYYPANMKRVVTRYGFVRVKSQ